MKNTFEHLHPDYIKYISLSKKERIQLLDNPYVINYPKFNEIIQLLNYIMNKPKKYKMDNYLIIGEPNTGKTTIGRKFASLHEDRIIEDLSGESITIKPVIYSSMESFERKELYVSILNQFYTSFNLNSNLLKLKYQAIHLLKKCKVQILILDEIHNLLKGTATKQRIMMDEIKNLSNELMIPIVGIGIKSAALILNTDEQHVSRFEIIKLDLWELDKNFRGLLQSFEKRIPLKKASNLSSKEKTLLLYNISRGNIGDLNKLLIKCATYAIENDIEEITEEIIKNFRPTATQERRRQL